MRNLYFTGSMFCMKNRTQVVKTMPIYFLSIILSASVFMRKKYCEITITKLVGYKMALLLLLLYAKQMGSGEKRY